MLSKAEEFGKIVITSVSEAYTSKTCSRCGYVRRNLGGNKVFDGYGLQTFLRALLDGALVM